MLMKMSSCQKMHFSAFTNTIEKRNENSQCQLALPNCDSKEMQGVNVPPEHTPYRMILPLSPN